MKRDQKSALVKGARRRFLADEHLLPVQLQQDERRTGHDPAALAPQERGRPQGRQEPPRPPGPPGGPARRPQGRLPQADRRRLHRGRSIQTAKILKDFAAQNKVLVMKGGVRPGPALRPREVRRDHEARLPGGAPGQDRALMASPLTMLLRTMQSPLSSWGGLMRQLKDKKNHNRNERYGKETMNVSKLTKEEFFAHLDGLTVLELADYIKEFESRYGISAAAAMPAAAAAPVAAEAKAERGQERVHRRPEERRRQEDQRDQDRPRDHQPRLKEAKDLVDGAPKPVKEGLSKADGRSDEEEIRRGRSRRRTPVSPPLFDPVSERCRLKGSSSRRPAPPISRGLSVPFPTGRRAL